MFIMLKLLVDLFLDKGPSWSLAWVCGFVHVRFYIITPPFKVQRDFKSVF
jgi:hypothetical protein